MRGFVTRMEQSLGRPRFGSDRISRAPSRTTLSLEVEVATRDFDDEFLECIRREGGPVYLSAIDYDSQVAGAVFVAPYAIIMALFMLDHVGENADELALHETIGSVRALWREAGDATRAAYEERAKRLVEAMKVSS